MRTLTGLALLALVPGYIPNAQAKLASQYPTRVISRCVRKAMDLSDALLRVWTAYSSGWGLVVSIGMYLWLSACLMVIARKGHVTGWWAGWIPIVNLQIVCAAGKSSLGCFWRLLVAVVAIAVGLVLWIQWWILLWLVLGAIAWTIAWSRICRERGRSPLLGLLVLVPVLNLVLFGLLAFGDQA